MQNITIHFISFFLSPEFIDTALVTLIDTDFVIFVGMVFATFIDVLCIAFIISSQTITEVSAYFLTTYHFYKYMHYDSNYNLFCTYDTFYANIGICYYSIFVLNCILYYRICICIHMKHVLPQLHLPLLTY